MAREIRNILEEENGEEEQAEERGRKNRRGNGKSRPQGSSGGEGRSDGEKGISGNFGSGGRAEEAVGEDGEKIEEGAGVAAFAEASAPPNKMAGKRAMGDEPPSRGALRRARGKSDTPSLAHLKVAATKARRRGARSPTLEGLRCRYSGRRGRCLRGSCLRWGRLRPDAFRPCAARGARLFRALFRAASFLFGASER